MKKTYLLISLAVVLCYAANGQTTLIPYGSAWKYLCNGSNLGTAWRAVSFSDATWSTGTAQLGYGDGDEKTIVSYGADSSKKYITSYFRKAITVTDTTMFKEYTINLKRDDGAVVYINGTEVFRSNMPSGTISYNTVATGTAGDNGNTPQTKALTISQLKKGTNVIAVEIHQSSITSSDLTFDMQLVANNVSAAASLTRGPYLNMALQTGIVIRWRTTIATNSKVTYGTVAGSLTQSFTDNVLTTEHVVTLTGLTANTRYYYSIGSTIQTLQGDANNYFKTMPVVGSTQKIRILAMGDMGTHSTQQVNVRNAWQTFNGTNYTDAWILLGDNAYNTGSDSEYQANFFNIYQGSMTKNHVLWPAPGNHDYANSSSRQADHAIPYYSIFTLPSNGQAGGVASSTEAYYSYNYGNIHFVALDSYGWETGNTRLYDTAGKQALWLKKDLAANTQQWTVVYFHHPPYTKGSHNSDTETDLINMRQRIVPILERYKVDLVLNGHSHAYERSFLINGHYGLESTFSLASHALSTSSGKYDSTTNSCAYIKNTAAVRNGIVYALIGSSGKVGVTTSGYPHNAMSYSNATNSGALYIEVENNKLTAKWIGGDGVIRDNFTIMKNVNKTTSVNLASGSSSTLWPSWTGTYKWSTGATSRSIIVAPTVNTNYTVADGAGCIKDVFNIKITALRMLNVQQQTVAASVKLYPTMLQKGQFLYVQPGFKESAEYIITDINGRLMSSYRFADSKQIETNQLLPGTYFLKWNSNNKNGVEKFVITN
jgi:acid phosphatase type 7